jgi:ribonuclease D
MMPAAEIRNFTWLSGESRQALMDAFNAVSQWRDEIAAANDRCLTKVLDQVAAAQRAQGWPNGVTVATREHLLKASKMQTQMIDQLMAEWEQQLKSKGTSPDSSLLRMPSATDPLSEMMRLSQMTLTPFKLWLSAAEAWQRSWADAVRGATDTQQTRPIRRAA